MAVVSAKDVAERNRARNQANKKLRQKEQEITKVRQPWHLEKSKRMQQRAMKRDLFCLRLCGKLSQMLCII